MSDQITNAPPSGWYADPEGSPRLRWWNGQAWTEHFQEAVSAPSHPPVAIASSAEELSRRETRNAVANSDTYLPSTEVSPQPVAPGVKPYSSTNNYNPKGDLAAGKNAAAKNGFVLGIIAMIVNPLLLVGIGAIVFSWIGLSRASRWESEGHQPFGKRKAIWGLVLGSVATAFTVFIKMGTF